MFSSRNRILARYTPSIAHINASRCYSINIKPVSQINTRDQVPIPENKSISQYMKEYKEWFPNDEVSNSLIESYERLHTYPQETIKIGVLYHDADVRKKSKIIETILADPLASNNQLWFNKIDSRSPQINYRFEYDTEVDITNTKFSIPAPVLGSVSRPNYMNPTTNVTLNDIVLYEINDLSTFSHFNTCHFFVYISDRLTSTMKLPPSISDRILMTVVDNNDFTPASSESSPFPTRSDGTVQIIKIDSEKSYQGIQDFLKNDIKASNNYLQSLVDSNIFQLLKIIGYNLQVEQLVTWNLTKLINKISLDEITLEELESLYSTLKSKRINQFSSEMHYELQNLFIPSATKFFNRKLAWWKLYYKNDNVEYDLKDYFLANFMGSSIENYNFLRGKIISELQNHTFGKYQIKAGDVSNPLTAMKNELIRSRITSEVQPVVTSSLVFGFLYYQLPTAIISVLAYQFFDFSQNAAASIFGLGLVMGFNYTSKKWETFTKEWLKDLYEQVRVCIDRDCVENGLLKELTSSYNEEKQLILEKRRIVEGIKRNL